MFEKLSKRFLWQPEPDEFLAPLFVQESHESGIERFSRGIDNTHIDVALSPRFMEHTHLVMRQELLEFVADQRWGGSRSTRTGGDLRVVREEYVGMMGVAIDKVRQTSRLGAIPLLQFSVIKYFFQAVNQEIERLRRLMQTSRESSRRQSSGRAVEIHERLVVLSKEDAGLRFRIVRRLMRELLKIEDMKLSKQRDSSLHCAWPVPREMLANPMIMIPSLSADEQLMSDYSIAFTDKDGPGVFDQVNRLLTSVFRDFLPAEVWPAETSSLAAGRGERGALSNVRRDHADPEILPGFYEVKGLLGSSLQNGEYERDCHTWLDIPENMERFFHSDRFQQHRSVSPGQPLWQNDRWPEFHGRTVRRLLRGLRNQGLEWKVLASHVTPEYHRQLGGALPARLISQYLAADLARKSMVRKLRSLSPQMNVEGALKVLDQGAAKLRRMPAAQRRDRLLQFILDFLVFRRDLKLAYRAHQIMNSIRILIRPADLELSGGNGTLNEFSAEGGHQPEQLRIRSLAVLKADVRGSTSIIRELRNRHLNPASHFSLNFFEPINRLLREYGAKKVFVEGDAVILSLFDYDDPSRRGLCVSLACGLARKILQVVEARNVSSRQNGLPELELGLGIAYGDEAPTFLYDELREIMISPAINRADQLSSCSAVLRKSEFGQALGDGVEVVAADGLTVSEKRGGDGLIRYNVNGIELDTPAFIKLQTEIALHTVVLDEDYYPGGSRFYAGKFSDIQGKMHWLVIREGAVRVWSGGKPGEGQQFGHRFYQVVTHPELIDQVQKKIRAGAPLSASEGRVEPATSPTGPHYLH